MRYNQKSINRRLYLFSIIPRGCKKINRRGKKSNTTILKLFSKHKRSGNKYNTTKIYNYITTIYVFTLQREVIHILS